MHYTYYTCNLSILYFIQTSTNVCKTRQGKEEIREQEKIISEISYECKEPIFQVKQRITLQTRCLEVERIYVFIFNSQSSKCSEVKQWTRAFQQP